MSEVQSVTVQVRAPTDNDPGQVTTGYYTVADGILTMTQPNGEPVIGEQGERFTQSISADDNVRAIAGLLTRKVRRAIRGETEFQERFRRPLQYGAP
jgi:hypothetical protein